MKLSGTWLLVLQCFLVRVGGNFYLTVRLSDKLTVVSDDRPLNTTSGEWLVKALYLDSANRTGWDILQLTTNGELDDQEQAFSAGWTEGFLTQKHIYYHWYNTQKNYCRDIPTTCNKIRLYIYQNLKWVKSEIEKSTDDPYWHQVNLFLKQLEGLYAGYRDAVTSKIIHQTLTYDDFIMMNFVTDIMTLQESLASKGEERFVDKRGHCSALIKLLPDYSDVFFAHNSWIAYNFMNRIIKRYNFAYRRSAKSNKTIAGRSQAFSSYAGVITSIDDFYIINSGLFVTETTNEVYDKRIYQNNKPVGQIFETIRSAVANRLAPDASSWAYYFSFGNSGTYNNQWMILDLNKFTPGSTPERGFLWVLEQMPGKIESQDQTQHLLRRSYWASYNIPFYQTIYNYSGYDRKLKEHGSFYSYEQCPRAEIFAREHGTVVDAESTIKLIRYNRYKTDPFSLCDKCNPRPNACMSIASRCDLNPKDGDYALDSLRFDLYGAIDAKIGSYSMFKAGEMISVSGPSGGDDLPPFQWSKAQPNNLSHVGQPDVWSFPAITTSWTRL